MTDWSHVPGWKDLSDDERAMLPRVAALVDEQLLARAVFAEAQLANASRMTQWGYRIHDDGKVRDRWFAPHIERAQHMAYSRQKTYPETKRERHHDYWVEVIRREVVTSYTGTEVVT